MGQATSTAEEIQPEHAEKEVTIPVPEAKIRQAVQQIPESAEATAHKYTFCVSFRANVKLCEIFKRYFGTKKNAGRANALTQESSHILQSKIPTKLKDPGSFTIHCSIRTRYAGRALCDLGASINLMSLSVFKQLGVGECRPTTVTLQLADRSHAYPEGKIEDVLMKLGVGECRPTTVTLQLADRSHAYPEGKIEDVLMKVEKFIFPVDFIVLDFEADK
ncbi:uncharacterized protein LOC112099118 [Citrus clementina]|uniref:uncharacterized protein LOC112099118 n=1 Tax=Citrus clementina TaxID=85681 RepID=UPI000CED6599|nr:uncharacterized protein LOC112099118 [Citrus x clementina]